MRRARQRKSASSLARRRVCWCALKVASGFRNGELQSGVYEVRIGNLVGIRCVDLFPLCRIPVKVFGDFAETVACFYSVGLAAGRSRSRAASVDVGEICCTAARRLRAANVGKGVVAWIRHRSSMKTYMLSDGGGQEACPLLNANSGAWGAIAALKTKAAVCS